MPTTERSVIQAATAAPPARAARIDVAAVRAALWPFMATRLAFLLIGLAAPVLFADNATRRPPVPTGTGWLRWDVQWFVGIAAHGYAFRLPTAPQYSPTAFFPLYPILIRVATVAGLDAGTAAALIANLAFLGALYYLYRLVRLDWPARVAKRTLWLLALFPTALAFFIPYTESLYLLLAVLTLWHLRNRRWLAAGVAGALGALTRQTGLVLLLPYLVEWIVARRRDPDGARPTLAALLPAVLMPLAVAGHLAYLWHVTGSPTAFLQAQRAWHRRPDWPWSGIVATVHRWGLADTTPLQHVHMALELAAVLLFVGLLAAGLRQVRPSYSVYAGAVWLAALVSPAIADNFRLPLMSSSRFALSVFPSFVVLALMLRRPGAYQTWLTASAMILGFLAAFYVVGGWVA